MTDGGRKKSHDKIHPHRYHTPRLPCQELQPSTLNLQFPKAVIPQTSLAFPGLPSAPIFPFDDPAPAPVAQPLPSLDELLPELPFAGIEFSIASDILAAQTKSLRAGAHSRLLQGSSNGRPYHPQTRWEVAYKDGSELKRRKWEKTRLHTAYTDTHYR